MERWRARPRPNKMKIHGRRHCNASSWGTTYAVLWSNIPAGQVYKVVPLAPLATDGAHLSAELVG